MKRRARQMRVSLRRHGEWLWAPALYAGVALLLYRSVWLGTDGVKGWFGWDTLESYWSDLGYLAHAIRHGEWPLWNPYDRLGYAFHADPQAGVYYPISWLLALGGAIAGSVPGWLIQAKVLAHHALAGTMSHLYLRSRSLPRAAAVFGGVLTIVSTPMLQHKASNVLWPMIWPPLVWLAIDRAVERAAAPGWWRRSAGLAGAVALAAVAGSPPGFFHVVVAGVLYGVFRTAVTLIAAVRGGQAWRVTWRLALTLALAAVVAALILAIAYLPVPELVARSPRAVRSFGYALAGGSLRKAWLHEWLVPQLGIGIYGGLLLVAFTAVALIVRPLSDRGAPLFMFVFGGLFASLSLGSHSPILPYLLKHHVPGFGLFRVPPRYMILANLAFAVAAAHGVGALLQAQPRRRRIVALVAIAVLIALAVAVVKEWAPGATGTAARHASLFVALAVLAAAGVVVGALSALPARAHGVLVLLLAVIAYLDVSTQAGRFLENFERPPDEQRQRDVANKLRAFGIEWRIFDEFVIEQRPGPRFGLRDMRGYPAGDPLQDERYRAVMVRAARDPVILEAYNVRLVLHGAHHRTGTGANWLKKPPAITAPGHFRRVGKDLYEALHPVPLVAWYGGVRLASSRDRALDALERLETSDERRSSAIVEQADIPPGQNEALARLQRDAGRWKRSVAGRLLSYGANRIAVEVYAPDRGLVVLNEMDFPGWRVTVDGVPATPIRADLLLRGVVVPARGRHVLVWTYVPPHWGVLVAAWLLGLGFLLLAGVSAVRRPRGVPSLIEAAPGLPPIEGLAPAGGPSAAARLREPLPEGLRRALLRELGGTAAPERDAEAEAGARLAAAERQGEAGEEVALRLEDELVQLLDGAYRVTLADALSVPGISPAQVLARLEPLARRTGALCLRLERAGLSAGGLAPRAGSAALRPLLRALCPGRVAPSARDALVAATEELQAELHRSGLERVLAPGDLATWAAAALVAGIETPSPAPPDLDLAGLSQLQHRLGASPLATLLAVLSARVWPETQRTLGGPLEPTSVVRELLDGLEPRLRDALCSAELARATMSLDYLEGRWASIAGMPHSSTAAGATDALEATRTAVQRLAEVMPACAPAASEVAARARRAQQALAGLLDSARR